MNSENIIISVIDKQFRKDIDNLIRSRRMRGMPCSIRDLTPIVRPMIHQINDVFKTAGIHIQIKKIRGIYR